MTIRSLLFSVAGIVLLGLLGIIAVQHRMLRDTREQLDTTQRELVTVKQVVIELERDAERTAERETARQTARDAIVSAPAIDDGAIAPLLLQGLRAADFIGGVE